MTWDRVELATGAVGHEAVPAEAEPPAERSRRSWATRLVTRCWRRMPPAGVRRCPSAIGVRAERREAGVVVVQREGELAAANVPVDWVERRL